ncbi:hypothetical protein BU14_0072s0002 [Porphyra umbilicalis]|uniref:Uncharacterized protein n=1 Tax=Porphyra umbilicalis TaxID=2786 RepID=A0A1X6PFL7_PORUM|nr:hypothetical protein BU14_0072s0002 [Porphyra umbilicalis]|eukprot:OSX79644.1 hypothetical protein BU14_0072s0002 [Porphyra umbilicalis]
MKSARDAAESAAAAAVRRAEDAEARLADRTSSAVAAADAEGVADEVVREMVATKVELAEERERAVKLRNTINKLANGAAADEGGGTAAAAAGPSAWAARAWSGATRRGGGCRTRRGPRRRKPPLAGRSCEGRPRRGARRRPHLQSPCGAYRSSPALIPRSWRRPRPCVRARARPAAASARTAEPPPPPALAPRSCFGVACM